jgi:hypothetical protein
VAVLGYERGLVDGIDCSCRGDFVLGDFDGGIRGLVG